jgi:hypothetical protein
MVGLMDRIAAAHCSGMRGLFRYWRLTPTNEAEESIRPVDLNRLSRGQERRVG